MAAEFFGASARYDGSHDPGAIVHLRDQAFDIIEGNSNIAVANQQPIVAREPVTSNEIIDLRITAGLDISDNELGFLRGVERHQRPDDLHRRVLRVGNGEKNFVIGVVEAKKSFQIFPQPGVMPLQWL